MSTITDAVREAVAPVLTSLGLHIYDVEHNGGMLRITVDAAGGVSIDALATATRAVSDLLDRIDRVPGTYTLEVSSPGLERALRLPEHYEGAVGATVTVKTVAGTEGDRRVTGVLGSVDEAGITVVPSGGEPRSISFVDIDKARTVFEWQASPKPGGKSKERAAS